jgi:NADH-quinone oxidoreductase subunit E
MVQINDDNYEDLDYDKTIAVLEALAQGKAPPVGSQTGRKSSEPAGGPTSLKAMVDENHDYRGEWA